MKALIALSLLATLFTCPNSWSLTESKYYLGAGMYNMNTLKTTDQDSAATSLLGPTYYPLQFRTYFPNPLFTESAISINLSHTLLTRETKDGAADTSFTLLAFPITTAFATPGWDWSAGLAAMLYKIDGKGGTVVLNNGTGTSTFARPGRSVTTKNILLELGLGYAQESWRIDFETYWAGVLGERRALNLMLTFSYQLKSGGI